MLPAYTREVAARDVDFLVNVTNDAWFLDTSEPHLHHMSARMRSIETRRELVRGVNTGVSGLIAATGERVVETHTFVETTLLVHVHSLHGTTLWVRFGDTTTPALVGALLALAFALTAKRMRAVR
jgi:apolipoprotein N-acyltransferase